MTDFSTSTGGSGRLPEAAEEATQRMLQGVRAAGLKVTPQRLAIIQELAADHSHPTAQELFNRLQPALPTMSFATVYNTLSSLSAAGLCTARSFAVGSATRFDPNPVAHDHAVCDGCGQVLDVPRRNAPSGEISGFEVRAVERIYRGRCGSCHQP